VFRSALVSMRIRIQLFTSVRIQIQGATPMRIRIQILVRLCHKTYLPRYKIHFEMLEIRLFCKFWSISLLLVPDPGPHSQYVFESGSRRVNSMRIHADPEGSKTLPNTRLSPVCKYMACGQILELTLARNPTAAFSVQSCLWLEMACEDI
jgi:hypothetical protein